MRSLLQLGWQATKRAACFVQNLRQPPAPVVIAMPTGIPSIPAVAPDPPPELVVTPEPVVVQAPTEPPTRPIICPTEAATCFPRRTFSALMCNYNHAKYVEQAMNAVLNQSRPPDEYLILDDASTDNSLEIIQSYAARYPCIKLVARKKNGGFVSGINELASLATGDYLHIGAARRLHDAGVYRTGHATGGRIPRKPESSPVS